jgi:hypothetical protein
MKLGPALTVTSAHRHRLHPLILSVSANVPDIGRRYCHPEFSRYLPINLPLQSPTIALSMFISPPAVDLCRRPCAPATVHSADAVTDLLMSGANDLS